MCVVHNAYVSVPRCMALTATNFSYHRFIDCRTKHGRSSIRSDFAANGKQFTNRVGIYEDLISRRKFLMLLPLPCDLSAY